MRRRTKKGQLVTAEWRTAGSLSWPSVTVKVICFLCLARTSPAIRESGGAGSGQPRTPVGAGATAAATADVPWSPLPLGYLAMSGLSLPQLQQSIPTRASIVSAPARDSGYLSDRSLGRSSDPLVRHQQQLAADNSLTTVQSESAGRPLIIPSPTIPTSAAVLCAQVPGLVAQQLKVCEAHPSAMLAVSEGARRGIGECQLQFKNERWNCTPEGDQQVFGHTLQRGSRETAFLYAVTSAGVVHAVTQACSAGNLTDCSCDRSRQGQNNPDGWKWGGCSDNTRYGMMFAKHFVDAPERLARKAADLNQDQIRPLMNLHNNQAGRLAIANHMELKCRCHGVSGSCELKTCWRTLPTFSIVGNYLKEKYENSIQISPKAKKRLRRRGKVKRKVPVRKEDLVHIHKSPNYCVEDTKLGILGTSGRSCNKTSTGPESCSLLCCGRGYNTQVFRQLERCHCKFHWCCHVTCNICENLMEVYTCK